MENGPFEDVFPIENGNYPLLCQFTRGYLIPQMIIFKPSSSTVNRRVKVFWDEIFPYSVSISFAIIWVRNPKPETRNHDEFETQQGKSWVLVCFGWTGGEKKKLKVPKKWHCQQKKQISIPTPEKPKGRYM